MIREWIQQILVKRAALHSKLWHFVPLCYLGLSNRQSTANKYMFPISNTYNAKNEEEGTQDTDDNASNVTNIFFSHMLRCVLFCCVHLVGMTDDCVARTFCYFRSCGWYCRNLRHWSFTGGHNSWTWNERGILIPGNSLMFTISPVLATTTSMLLHEC